MVLSQVPLAKTGNISLDQFISRLKSEIDPVLGNQVVNGLLLRNISLVTGNNVINHLLGRMMLGWIIVDSTAGATIYRATPLDSKTLTLNASAPATIALWVF